MINIKHLAENTALYVCECEKRGKKTSIVFEAESLYVRWKGEQVKLDLLRSQKNEFNEKVVSLAGEEKMKAIGEMKSVSDAIKNLENEQTVLKADLDSLISKIPNLSSQFTPVGKSDDDNVVTKTVGTKPEFSFTPKPYHELEVYKKYVDQVKGAKNMGSRGFYMTGQLARFQKVLFDWAEEVILNHGHEYMYVPLMLNTTTLTGTGHYPDFDGQMYEVKLEEDKSYFLVGSSEPSMISFYANETVNVSTPLLFMANTTCFRKEAGSYGKDQQGILRVHQFEKIEMNAICKPEDNDTIFELHGAINDEILGALGLHYEAVEVCSGDMPAKHYRQVDFNAWFPGEGKFREVCSNGSASNFQNRTLGMNYITTENTKEVPWGLNCTGITFRAGLAIMEQFQTEDGKVKLPKVVADRMGVEYLE